MSQGEAARPARRARVRLHGADVGVLEETGQGEATRFTYLPSHVAAPGARPIGPHMPLQLEPYESEVLHPMFSNLLHGIYAPRAHRGIDRSDTFGWLLMVGTDLLGAIEVLPMAAEP